MSVYMIDYGMGNLLSVKRAFEKCGADVIITQNPAELLQASHIVLPGVGSFRDGMKNLRENYWVEILNQIVRENRVPILGICLGMQLLADKGYEVEETKGLGYIPGKVVLMQAGVKERIPHVGWNEVHIKNESSILNGIKDKTDFYFVHSYHFDVERQENIVATTPYGGDFVSLVNKDLVFGTQFHPEKSQKAGFQLIKNFLFL